MSVGYRTRRTGLSFNDCRTGGLFRPEVGYSINGGHAGNSSENGIVIEIGEQTAGTTRTVMRSGKRSGSPPRENARTRGRPVLHLASESRDFHLRAYPALVHFLMRSAASLGAVEDAAQEAFTKAWRRVGQRILAGLVNQEGAWS